jgi:hypothetical protein
VIRISVSVMQPVGRYDGAGPVLSMPACGAISNTSPLAVTAPSEQGAVGGNRLPHRPLSGYQVSVGRACLEYHSRSQVSGKIIEVFHMARLATGNVLPSSFEPFSRRIEYIVAIVQQQARLSETAS